MQHSSRKNPCPVCFRTKDDKCRISATRIFCYVGDSFSPPSSLRLGDLIKINGEQWKLISCNAGFSQNSYAFALAKEIDYRFLSAEDKRQFRRNCIRSTAGFFEKQAVVKALMKSLKTEDVFHEISLSEFYANKANTKRAVELLSDLVVFCSINKRYLAASEVDAQEPKQDFQSARSLLSAIYSFERSAFDSPSPEEFDYKSNMIRL